MPPSGFLSSLIYKCTSVFEQDASYAQKSISGYLPLRSFEAGEKKLSVGRALPAVYGHQMMRKTHPRDLSSSNPQEE